jgi:MATE family multidrug resistance protein
MSAIITCLAPFQGLATALDTLCSQCYGSGHKELVGVYCQRMMLILLILSAPIAVLWAFSEPIFLSLLPDVETAILCSRYLKIIIFAIPGYGAFEAGKRFLQAQGLFRATTYILLVGAPLHASFLWLFVWKLELGFIGAPISVALTRTILPLLLVAYVRIFGGSECWGGFTKRMFLNIGPMLRLAIPGMIMVEAEMLCFEIMTIVSSRFGVDYLAAQSIFATLATLSSQVPLSLAVAASTRVAILIGAGRVADAKRAAKVVSHISNVSEPTPSG